MFMGYIGLIVGLLVILWLWTSGGEDSPSPIEQAVQTQAQVTATSNIVGEFNEVQKAQQREQEALLK